ncbi:MAG: ABC transporter substrate-binding protein [Limnochordia bacterium]|nr:ABC transporter substrate-binding protein [Limnochordia bacterium]
MKRISLALVVLLLVSSVALAQQVRIGGHGGTDTVILEEMIELFVRPGLVGTGITVQYEPIADDFQRYIVNALSAGTAPDLFYMDIFWAGSLMRSGTVEPLNAYLEASTVLRKEHIIPSLLDAFTIDGQVYGIPKDFNTLAVFFNKDLFDYAGVEYLTNDETWDTFHEKLAAVAAIDPDIYGLALAPEYGRFGALANAAGFAPFDANGATDLSDPAFVDAFRWYTGMTENDVGVMPADISQGWGGGALASEQVAAALEGAWVIGALRDEAPNMQYGATLLPKHPETGQRGNLIFTVAWGLNSSSPHKDAAFKVLELLTSEEAQQWILERGLAIPSREALADNPYFQQDHAEARANYTVFLGASDGHVLPYSFGIYGGDWMQPIDQALSSVLSKQSTWQDALQEAQTRIDAVMQR